MRTTRTTATLLFLTSLSLSTLASPPHHVSNHLERRMRVVPRAAASKSLVDPPPSATATPISGPDAVASTSSAPVPTSVGKKGAQSTDSTPPASPTSSQDSIGMDPTPTLAFSALPASSGTSTMTNGTVVAAGAAVPSSTAAPSVMQNVLSAFHYGSPYFALAVFISTTFAFVSILVMIGIGKYFAHRPQFADPADYPEGLPTRANSKLRNKIRPQSSTWITPAYGRIQSGSEPESSGSDEAPMKGRGGRGEVDGMSEKRWKEEEREEILPKARRSSTIGRHQKGRAKVLKGNNLPRIPEMAHKRSGSGSSSEGEFEYEERRRSYSSNFSATSFGGLSSVLGGYARSVGQHSYPASLRPATPDSQSMHTISSGHPSSLRPSTPNPTVEVDLLGPSFIPISLRPTSPAFSIGSGISTNRGPSPAPTFASDHTFSSTPYALRRQLPTPPTDPSAPPSRGPSPRPLPRPSLSNPSRSRKPSSLAVSNPKARAHFLDVQTDSDSGSGSGSWSSDPDAGEEATVVDLRQRSSEKVYRSESNVPAAGRKTTRHHNHTRRQSRRPSGVPSVSASSVALGGVGRVHEPYSWQGPIERSLPPPEVGGELQREEWRGVGEFARR